MSRRKLSTEQYKEMLLHATPPADRWKNGVRSARLRRTVVSLFRRNLLAYVESEDRDDRVVPTTEGWRALRAYEETHGRCDNCGCPSFVVE
jgi:hypothetical protein